MPIVESVEPASFPETRGRGFEKTPRLASCGVRAAASLASASLLLGGCLEPAAPPPAKPPVQVRKTVNKTTQRVLDLQAALADGGVLADTTVSSGGLDAITDAARTSTGKIGVLSVEHKMKLHEAEHGRRPKTHAEFMTTIIAAGTGDEVRLPMLPYYQEWAYDPASGQVVVVEFPAKKAQRQAETTGAAGL
jgi:hypothetical protein